MKMPRITEKILVTDKGYVVAGRPSRPGREIRHLPDEYDVVSDKEEDGCRVLRLRPRDMTQAIERRKAVVEEILRRLGERSKALRDVLDDSLGDLWAESIDDLYDRVVVKKEKVSTAEGCFKIYVGDGRTKNSREIMIR